MTEQEAPQQRHRLLEELAERRERHLKRPRIVRFLVVLAGATVLLAGLVMFVTPGPALVVIPIGLAMLALEFAWAERMLERAIDRAEAAGRVAKETTRTQRIVTAIGVVLAASAFAAWAWTSDVPLLPV